MKRLFLMAAAGVLAGAMLTGCSALDGKPDRYDERGDGAVSDRVSSTSPTVTTTRTADTARSTDTRTSSNTTTTTTARTRQVEDDSRTMSERAGDTADRARDKVDEITDDVADGINGGLDATQSIVDDVLR